MNVNTANSSTPFGFYYNAQESLPSRYVRHQQVYVYPTQNNSIRSADSNKKIKFLAPPNGFLDSKSSFLAFNASASSTDSTDLVRFVDSTECWIDNFNILTPSGVPVDQFQAASTLAAINRRNVDPQYEQSVGRSCLNMLQSVPAAIPVEGAATEVGLNNIGKTLMAKSGHRYVAELSSSGFWSKAYTYLPLKTMAINNSNSLQIELQFAPKETMVVATADDGTSAPAGDISYTISDIVLVCNIIYDDAKEEQLMKQVEDTPIVISFDARKNYSSPLPAGTTSTIQIAEFQEQVKFIDTVFLTTNNISDQTKDSTIFSNPNIKQYQYQVGVNYYPAQPVITQNTAGTLASNAELYYNRAITKEKQRNYSRGFFPTSIVQNDAATPSTIAISTDSNDFILNCDFRIVPDYSMGDPMYHQYYAGLNLKSNPQPIQMKLTYGSVTTNQYTVFSYTDYISNLVLQSNESYVVS